MTSSARRWWPTAAGAAVLLAALAGSVLAMDDAGTADRPAPASAPQPVLLRVAPVPDTGPPATGEAVLAAGPFTDRLALRDLTLLRTGQVGVSGTFAQVVEIGELLVIEVQADFYDGSGTLLGSESTAMDQDDIVNGGLRPAGSDERPGGDVDFAVTADAAYADRVASAVVSVPVLVNE